MGIEDIERHIYNYKLFVAFLQKEKQYMRFKDIMFLKANRTPKELFKVINNTKLGFLMIKSRFVSPIDAKWSCIFSFVPFVGFYWSDFCLGRSFMENLSKKWISFLEENNFNKIKNK